jgi:hypothetical protein
MADGPCSDELKEFVAGYGIPTQYHRTTSVGYYRDLTAPVWMVFDGLFNSWVIKAPAASVAPFFQFDTLLELPGFLEAAGASVTDMSGASVGDTRTITMGELSFTESCLATSDTGHSYTLDSDVKEVFKFTNYRGTFAVSPVCVGASV